MNAKPWFKSFTFWSLVLSFLGLALAGIGRGEPLFDILGDPAVQGTLGEILAAIGAGGVLLGRARATVPLTIGRGGKDDRGSIRLALLAIIASLALLGVAWFLGAGCASREVVTDRPIAVEWWEGPPCRVEIRVGGEAVRTVRNPPGSALRCAVAPGDGR